MGRIIWTILGIVLAIWVAFMAIGWISSLLNTFLVAAVIAVGVVFVVSLLAKRSRRD